MNLEYLEKLYFKPLKGIDKLTDADKEIADIHLNIAYKEVFIAHNWIYRKRYGQITLIPRYKTGTVSVTKYNETNEANSKTITFTGASLSTNMVGRFIKFQDGDKWYRILYLTGSGSSWTGYLDSPVTDVETGGGKTFEIWKRFYNLKSDVHEFLDFGRWENGRLEYNPDLIDRYSDLSRESDSPSSFDVFEVDPFTDIVEDDGTISIAKDSNLGTVTGVNLLSSGYDVGDMVEISNVDYYIKRIETDSRLIFFNYFPDEVTANTPIILKKNNPLSFEFYNPVDDYFSLPYAYLGKSYDLVHKTKDKILLPNNFIPAIVTRAQTFAMKDANDTRLPQFLAIYNGEIEGLKSKVQIVKSRYVKFNPAINRNAPGRG